MKDWNTPPQLYLSIPIINIMSNMGSSKAHRVMEKLIHSDIQKFSNYLQKPTLCSHEHDNRYNSILFLSMFYNTFWPFCLSPKVSISAIYTFVGIRYGLRTYKFWSVSFIWSYVRKDDMFEKLVYTRKSIKRDV